MKKITQTIKGEKSSSMEEITRTNFLAYCHCAKEFWLDIYKPDLAERDDDESRLKTKQEVDKLARQLFENITIVPTDCTVATRVSKTQPLITKGTETIANATFRFGSCICSVDIMHKTENGWAIYLVKSSSMSDEKYEKAKNGTNYESRKLQRSAQSLAYQKYVLEQNGITVDGTYLMCLNSNYVRGEKLDINKLFYIIDIKELVDGIYNSIDAKVIECQTVLSQNTEPCIDMGANCKDCPFFNHCCGGLPEKSVFDLYSLNFEKAVELFKTGKKMIKDLDKGEYKNAIQRTQIGMEQGKPAEYINKEAIQKFTAKLSVPLYFLDFETVQYAIPQFANSKPYQQIPFQYSLHIYDGSKLEHTEFLGNAIDDPRRALAEQLVNDIPINSCVLVYNKKFECGRIKEMAGIFRDLEKHLMNIHDNIVDLLEPFQQGAYYLRAMNGSCSIKKVLPALYPNERSLNYHNLNGGVQNGVEAMSVYPLMKDMTLKDREKTRKALLEYCKLDTKALFKIWEKLKTYNSNTIKNNNMTKKKGNDKGLGYYDPRLGDISELEK